MYSKLNFKLTKFICDYSTWLGVNCVLNNPKWNKTKEKFLIIKLSYTKARRNIGLLSLMTLIGVLRTIERHLANDNLTFPICYIFSVILTLLSTSALLLLYNVHLLVSLSSQLRNYADDFKGKYQVAIKDNNYINNIFL